MATTYSADEPNSLRGPEHDTAWADELCAWNNLEDAWSNLRLGLRLGDPRMVITTTPRPSGIIRQLLKGDRTHVTRMTTYDNAINLAPEYIEDIKAAYEGTSLGQQEIYADILDEAPGALWNRDMIDAGRVDSDGFSAASLRRVVVAVDPAMTTNNDSAETGIIVIGIDDGGDLYVLRDASCKRDATHWAMRAVGLFKSYQADRIVAEVNQGGDLVENTIRQIDPDVPYRGVRATRGKRVRAEPIAALYEQGRLHHVGIHGELENQMCSFVQGNEAEGADRVDALVWGATELITRGGVVTPISFGNGLTRSNPWKV